MANKDFNKILSEAIAAQKKRLKPCPFCGGSVDLMWWDSEHQNEKRWEPCDEDEGVVFPFVRCSECDGTFFFDTPYGTGSAVTNAWGVLDA